MIERFVVFGLSSPCLPGPSPSFEQYFFFPFSTLQIKLGKSTQAQLPFIHMLTVGVAREASGREGGVVGHALHILKRSA